jgi:hypothetical protein
LEWHGSAWQWHGWVASGRRARLEANPGFVDEQGCMRACNLKTKRFVHSNKSPAAASTPARISSTWRSAGSES